MGFWILAATAGVIAVAVLGYALVTAKGDEAAGQDVQIYRDQLKELERDLARGVIGADEAERARVEISRRLLEADRNAQAGARAGVAPRAASLSALALISALLLGGGVWLYANLGAVLDRPVSDTLRLPQVYPDMPLQGRIADAKTIRETRPSQDEVEAELPEWTGPPDDAPQDYLDLVARLREAVVTRPDDLEGLTLLATHEANLRNYKAARVALGRAIELKAGDVTSNELSQYADLLVLAADGIVSPEAEAVLDRALAINPRDPVAHYYTGLMFAQTGRPDVAFRLWRDLLATSQPDAPWVPPIRGQIEVLAAMAGVDYDLPGAPVAPGPSMEDMEAAADMSPAERAQMVEDMINRLMSRLAAEGGPAEDWARLITALGADGATDRARAIYEESLTVFVGFPEDLALLNAAARQAGLTGDAPTAPATTALNPHTSALPAPAEMTPEMVDELMAQLASQGGTAPQWARLIAALVAQGDRDRAAAIYDEAREVFGALPGEFAVIQDAARGVGLDLGAVTIPAPGPSADDMAAAADMSTEDRGAMIAGMVSQLAERLASDGGSADEWARLITAYSVMGNGDGAAEALTTAKAAYAGDDGALAVIDAAAEAAGVSP